jgi:hypothetical protein
MMITPTLSVTGASSVPVGPYVIAATTSQMRCPSLAASAASGPASTTNSLAAVARREIARCVPAAMQRASARLSGFTYLP